MYQGIIHCILKFLGKICTKHISRLLWKMTENMFFLDSEHVMVGMLLPKFTTSIEQVQVVAISPPNFPTKNISVFRYATYARQTGSVICHLS